MTQAKLWCYIKPEGKNIPSRKYILISSILGSVVFYNTALLANPVTTVTPSSQTEEIPSVALPTSKAEPMALEPMSQGLGQQSSNSRVKSAETARAIAPPKASLLAGGLKLADSFIAALGAQGGLAGGKFRGEAPVTGSLAKGLNLAQSSVTSTVVNTYIQNAFQIPDHAIDRDQGATEISPLMNYPSAREQDVVRTRSAPLPSASDLASNYIADGENPTPTEEPTQTGEEVSADEAETLRQQLRLQPLPVGITPSTLGAAASPGSSSGSPTAFGASFGNAFVGASYQGRTRFTDTADGAVSAGFGLGDPRKTVGVEMAVSVLDLTASNGDNQAFDRGSVSFKVHRVLPRNFAIAAGVENALVWGFTDAGTSAYGVVSKIFQLQERRTDPYFSSLTVSVGLGNGRFRSEDDFNNDRGTVNVFGSAGLRIAEPVSLIADWTGQDLTIGASIVPFRKLPLVITPAIADITGNAGDGSRFILGVGYNYSFSF